MRSRTRRDPETGRYEPSSINPDSGMAQITDAVVDESLFLEQLPGSLGHLLKVLTIRLGANRLDRGDLDRLAALGLFEDEIGRVIEKLILLRADVARLRNDPAILAAMVDVAPACPGAQGFADSVTRYRMSRSVRALNVRRV